MLNKLPGGEDKTPAWQITALNFSRTAIEQSLDCAALTGEATALWSNLDGVISENLPNHNECLSLKLLPLEARLIVVSEMDLERSSC